MCYPYDKRSGAPSHDLFCLFWNAFTEADITISSESKFHLSNTLWLNMERRTSALAFCLCIFTELRCKVWDLVAGILVSYIIALHNFVIYTKVMVSQALKVSILQSPWQFLPQDHWKSKKINLNTLIGLVKIHDLTVPNAIFMGKFTHISWPHSKCHFYWADTFYSKLTSSLQLSAFGQSITYPNN